MASPTDRIEKKVFLRAPHQRIWLALTDAKEFGSWFGVRFDGPFRPGAVLQGVIVPTTVDPEVAKTQEPYEGARFEITVAQIVAESLFSFRWHPFAIGDLDYSAEPTTLVAFELQDVTGGVMLTVTESGFDRIPLERRAKAFAANDSGWGKQVELIEKYLGQAA
jgi:uncharacterized protein YndB with AHSA1/START domain